MKMQVLIDRGASARQWSQKSLEKDLARGLLLMRLDGRGY